MIEVFPHFYHPSPNHAHKILSPASRCVDMPYMAYNGNKLVKVRNGYREDVGDMSLTSIASNMTEYIAENVFPVIESTNKEKHYEASFAEKHITGITEQRKFLDAIILHSYSTAVAAFIPAYISTDGTGGLLLVTDEYYSSTTTRHMSKWFAMIGEGRHMELRGDPTLMYHDTRFASSYYGKWKGKSMPARWREESPIGLKKLMVSPWVEPADRYVLEGEVDEQ